jgi:drug/metabolite transporter (DMT)-like permease
MNTPGPPASLDASAKRAGRLWVLAAALMWSSSGLFAKLPLWDDWPQDERGPIMAFWRAFFAFLVLVPSVRNPRWNPRLVPLAVVFAVMNLTYLVALTRTTAANAIWLQATAPWWVFLISVAFLRAPIIRRDLVPLGFGFVGVGLILAFEAVGKEQTGVFCGVASGIGFAGPRSGNSRCWPPSARFRWVSPTPS